MNAHVVTGIVISLVAVAILALVIRYGADSRDGRDWRSDMLRPGPARRPHRPAEDLKKVVRRIRAAHQRQVALHERYLERQRPWLSRRLHWKGRHLMGWLVPDEATDREEQDRTGVH
jgi:hypothetical protein